MNTEEEEILPQFMRAEQFALLHFIIYKLYLNKMYQEVIIHQYFIQIFIYAICIFIKDLSLFIYGFIYIKYAICTNINVYKVFIILILM